MHSMLVATIVLLLGMDATTSASVAEHLPPPMLKGLQALQDGKCRDAFDLWTSSWQSGDDAVKRQQLMSGCELLAQVGGPFHGYDIVRVVNVTPHLCRAFVLLRYEKQPMYLLLTAYAPSDDQWKVVTVTWHTDPNQVFPAGVLNDPAP
jgi:hypothetical protein